MRAAKRIRGETKAKAKELAKAMESPMAYDTGVLEKQARKFCSGLLNGMAKLREKLIQDASMGLAITHSHLESTNDLTLACSEFMDRLDEDSCFFIATSMNPPTPSQGEDDLLSPATPEPWDAGMDWPIEAV